ncbi:hypothetical protein [Hoylesella buccalis]|uniref:Lipoprotein n=1 Tax=Hoylesella buccalis DNF00853 TaxID=1401074 RepID=A0A096BNS7_9BACT|nr:hypothetical protein [Hoylesella buccalis]KGF34829.1 hypothetical protein HMPREF2137_06610 [Hoylesella buccalis DNF00853]
MKTKLFVSFTAFVAASVLMCSCSNEESADSNNNSNSNGQLTAFTGGIVTEAPMERMQLSTPEISTEVPGFLTRTSMNRNALRGQGAFLWEPKDVIYVEDDNNKLYKSQNTINDAVARATFLVDGSYTKKEYDVYYCGTNSGAGEKKVVIASNQTQVAFNNTKHFGAAGDCGVAKATKTTVAGKSGYRFDLAHKASYLCFLPYMTSEEQRKNYKIKSIEITSDNNIAGTYDLTQTGLSATGTNESKTITLHVGNDGLLLANQTAEVPNIDNSVYVVIAPGTHALKVKYTILDTKNKVMTITKSYKSHNFGANKICDISVSLGATDLYSGHNYYMWDAKENYWSGHEWDSDNPWQLINGRKNSGYPESKSKDGARWYNEGSGAFQASVNSLFKKLPNIQEIAWYVMKGDAHWDNTTKWTAFKKTYTGGIWLKKLSVIANDAHKNLSDLKREYPQGIVVSGSDFVQAGPLQSGKPAESEIDKYFFLPALGCYGEGTLYGLGSRGFYWSSSSDPFDENNAFSLSFDSQVLQFGNTSRRYNGGVAQPFE